MRLAGLLFGGMAMVLLTLGIVVAAAGILSGNGHATERGISLMMLAAAPTILYLLCEMGANI